MFENTFVLLTLCDVVTSEPVPHSGYGNCVDHDVCFDLSLSLSLSLSPSLPSPPPTGG